MPGFDLVAEHVELEERIAAADVVVTGEGYLDAQSLEGKVVGGVCELAAAAGRPVVVIAGDADAEVAAEVTGTRRRRVVSLVAALRRGAPVQRAALVHRARRGRRRVRASAPATRSSVERRRQAGGVPRHGTGGRRRGGRRESASVLPAVSVPTISRTVDVPRPLSIGGGIGIAAVWQPAQAGADDGCDRGARGVAGDVVDDGRGEVGAAVVVAGLAHRVAGGGQRRAVMPAAEPRSPLALATDDRGAGW